MSGTDGEFDGFRILAQKPLYRGFLKLDQYQVEVATHDGRHVRYAREVENHGAAVAVLTYDATRKVAVLVRQIRVAVAIAGEAPLLDEVVAGLLDVEGEGPEATARREALEEAGLALGSVEPAGAMFSAPGMTVEKIHLYLAEVDLGRDRVAAGGGADHEDEYIEVVEVPLAQLADDADRGAIRDMKTFALVQTLRLRRPDLFG